MFRLIRISGDEAIRRLVKCEIYVRQAIERGLADSKAGRTTDVKEVRAKYGLPE